MADTTQDHLAGADAKAGVAFTPGKMNPEVKARWVAALRSGEYKQGAGQLRTAQQAFCCLGVLCDLYAKESELESWDSFELGREGGDLPADEVCVWAGFPTDEDGRYRSKQYDPQVLIGGVAKPLSSHNDNGATFAQIAQAIEEQL
jgi:hypothetical protein